MVSPLHRNVSVSPSGTPTETGARGHRPRRRLLSRFAIMKKFSNAQSAWSSAPAQPQPQPQPQPQQPPETNNNVEKPTTLPQTFSVRVLGWRECRGLWGIRHTRGPVDEMVAAAKALPAGSTLPRATLEVSSAGIRVDDSILPIDSVSYGVQDLVFTRVFCCVLVAPPAAPPPFRCHAFVCDSRQAARSLTFALAAAFREYSVKVQKRADPDHDLSTEVLSYAGLSPRTVDLRSPEEKAAGILAECRDSEA